MGWVIWWEWFSMKLGDGDVWPHWPLWQSLSFSFVVVVMFKYMNITTGHNWICIISCTNNYTLLISTMTLCKGTFLHKHFNTLEIIKFLTGKQIPLKILSAILSGPTILTSIWNFPKYIAVENFKTNPNWIWDLYQIRKTQNYHYFVYKLITD